MKVQAGRQRAAARVQALVRGDRVRRRWEVVAEEATNWAWRQVWDLQEAGHFDRGGRKGVNREEAKQKTLMEMADARQRSLLREVSADRWMQYDVWVQKKVKELCELYNSRYDGL